MSKKQFDHIEDRIREAAANSEPPFDEHAWSDMEARLNKDDRRRRFLFWWFALAVIFIGSGTAYFFFNTPIASNTIAQVKEKNIQQLTPILNTIPFDENKTANQKKRNVKQIVPLLKNDIPGDKQVAIKRIVETTATNKQKTAATILLKHSSEKKFIVKKGIKIILAVRAKKLNGIKKSKVSSTITNGETEVSDDLDTIKQKRSIVSTVTPFTVVEDNKKAIQSQGSITLKDSLINSIAKKIPGNKNKLKIKENTFSRFYFLASVGGEVGSVQFLSFKNNPVTAKYGAGIGYQFTKKISLQTGFYVGTKKYVAGPDDYKVKEGSYWNMVQIVKVDAACLVYDIPVTLRYNFLQKPTLTYYLTTGLSSFIMKREDYYYYYIRNYMPHESSYSYTGNKHVFAVLNFSAGIEKKLSSAFSLQVEPSVSIPLYGVGDGRVKLYGVALQFGVKYQPIKKH